MRCTDGLAPCVTFAAWRRATARAVSRLTADTSPIAMRRGRLCLSLYWWIHERRPEFRARLPKPRQAVSRDSASDFPGGQCILLMLALVKLPLLGLAVGRWMTSAPGSTVEASAGAAADCS